MAAKKKSPTRTKEIQVKVFFNEADHRLVRIAAAVKNVTMQEFIREIVLQEASTITKKMNLD